MQVASGRAIIPITGLLFNRRSLLTELFASTTYDASRAALNQAVTNRAVSAIVLDIDSPGGAVFGPSNFRGYLPVHKREIAELPFVENVCLDEDPEEIAELRSQKRLLEQDPGQVLPFLLRGRVAGNARGHRRDPDIRGQALLSSAIGWAQLRSAQPLALGRQGTATQDGPWPGRTRKSPKFTRLAVDLSDPLILPLCRSAVSILIT